MQSDLLLPARYNIKGFLHKGIHSTLYLAKDCSTQKHVVIKFFEAEGRSGYLREVAAGLDLSHPNIVECLDTFYLNANQACLVYEYITGGSLAEYLNDHSVLSFEEILKCLESILQALVYLHEKGRIHCDVKPANILLRPKRDATNDYILADFGATCFTREATIGRYPVGSPAYTAPERLYDPFCPNSDLYSLGILAYELAVGCLPFTGSIEAIIKAHFTQYPDFSRIKHSLLRNFIESLLVKNPTDRILNAQVALKILRKVRQGTCHFQNTAMLSYDVAPIQISQVAPKREAAWVLRSQIFIKTLPESLILLQDKTNAIIGLQQYRHIEFITDQGQSRADLTLIGTTGCHALDNQRLVYTSNTSINMIDVSLGHRYCLVDDCHGVLTVAVKEADLLWRQKKSWHIANLHQKQQNVCRANDYAFLPQGAVVKQDRYVLTRGVINQQLCLYSQQANFEQSWDLGGPILALTVSGMTVLALTMVTAQAEKFSVWCIPLTKESRSSPVRSKMLPRSVEQWYCTPGFIWLQLEDSENFQGCDASLELFDTGISSVDSIRFSVSFDHRFFVTLRTGSDSKNSHNKYKLNLWTQ